MAGRILEVESRFRKIVRWALPFLVVLLTGVIGLWIWDSKNYPLPQALNPPRDPFGANLSPFQEMAASLREAKTSRFWRSLDLNSSAWKVTHLGTGSVSTVRFENSRILVQPPDVKIGIPFVHNGEYEVLDDRIIEAMIPVVSKSGESVAIRKRASFEGFEADGRIYLQTTASDDFVMEKIK